MKIHRLIFLSATALMLTSLKCKKDVISPERSLDNLAPATQIGQNIFGCLINGDVFTASDQFSKPENVSTTHTIYGNNGLVFYLVGSRNTAPNVYANLYIRVDSVTVSQGQTIALGKDTINSAWAVYEVDNYGQGTSAIYNSVATKPGKLTFTHIDLTKNIFSGTFSFEGVRARGDTVNVTEGRFDVSNTVSTTMW